MMGATESSSASSSEEEDDDEDGTHPSIITGTPQDGSFGDETNAYEVKPSTSTTFVDGEKNSEDRADGLPLSLEGLFDWNVLRKYASQLPESTLNASLQSHHTSFVRWLESRKSRRDEYVTREQVVELLSTSRGLSRDFASKLFNFLDIEGTGRLDVSHAIEMLNTPLFKHMSSTAFSSLSFVNKCLRLCSLTPGKLDIFTEHVDLEDHCVRIADYLRSVTGDTSLLPSGVNPDYDSYTDLRMSVLKHWMNKFVESYDNKSKAHAKTAGPLSDSDKCYEKVEVSSGERDMGNILDGDPGTFWQSDGPARSHWIRIQLKEGFVLTKLAIGVASDDSSYAPQLIAVSAGNSVESLEEERQITIPSNLTGDFEIPPDFRKAVRFIQLNVRRCHQDGCDVRVRGLTIEGEKRRSLEPTNTRGVEQVASEWFLDFLLTMAEFNARSSPELKAIFIKQVAKALQQLPPMSLCQSGKTSGVPSVEAMARAETFLKELSKGEETSDEVTVLMVRFAAARGNIASFLELILSHWENPFSIPKGLALELSESIDYCYSSNAKTLSLKTKDVSDPAHEDSWKKLLNWSNFNGVTFSNLDSSENPSVIVSFETKSERWFIPLFVSLKVPTSGMWSGPKNRATDLEIQVFAASEPSDNSGKVLGGERISTKVRNGLSCLSELHIQLQPHLLKYLVIKITRSMGCFSGASGALSMEAIKIEGLEVKKRPSSCGTQKIGICQNPMVNSNEMLAHARELLRIQSLIPDLSVATIESFPAQTALLCSQKAVSQEGSLATTESRLMLLEVLQIAVEDGRLVCKNSDEKKAATEILENLMKVVHTDNTQLSHVAYGIIVEGTSAFFSDPKERKDKLFSFLQSEAEGMEKTSNDISSRAVFFSLCKHYTGKKLSDAESLVDLPRKVTGITGKTRDDVLELIEKLLSITVQRMLSNLKGKPNSPEAEDLILMELVNAQMLLVFVWLKYQKQKLKKFLAVSSLTKKSDLEQIYCFLNGILMGIMELLVKNLGKLLGFLCSAGDSGLFGDSLLSMPEMLRRMDSDFVDGIFRPSFLLTMHALGEESLENLDRGLLSLCLNEVLKVFKEHSVGGAVSSYVANELKKISSVSTCHQPLSFWLFESAHPCRSSQHSDKSKAQFKCNGAVEFKIEFGKKCEISEARGDSLKFTSHTGTSHCFENKIPQGSSLRSSSDWPFFVSLASRNWLDFNFTSADQSEFENPYDSKKPYGFDLRITAIGKLSLECSWLADLYLTVTKLSGMLCSAGLSASSQLTSCEDNVKFLGILECLATKQQPKKVSNITDLAADFTFSFQCPLFMDGSSNLTWDWKKIVEPLSFVDKSSWNVFENLQLEKLVFSAFCAFIRHSGDLQEKIVTEFELLEQKNCKENLMYVMLHSDIWKPECVIKCRLENAVKAAIAIGNGAVIQRQRKAQELKDHSSKDLECKKNEVMEECLSRIKFLCLASPTHQNFDVSCPLVTEFILSWDLDTADLKSATLELDVEAEMVSTVLQLGLTFLKDHSSSRSVLPFGLFFLREFLSKSAEHSKSTIEERCVFAVPAVQEHLSKFLKQMVICVKTAQSISPKQEETLWMIYLNQCLLQWIKIQSFNQCLSKDEWMFVLKSMLQCAKISEDHLIVPTTLVLEEPVSLDRYRLYHDWLEVAESELGFDNFIHGVKAEEAKGTCGAYSSLFLALYSERLKQKVYCSSCKALILKQVRFRCLDPECKETELCRGCFRKGITPSIHQYWHRMVFLEYQCDQCRGFIAGKRYHCEQCRDYDLCNGCYKLDLFKRQDKEKNGTHSGHSKDHMMHEIAMEELFLTNPGLKQLTEYLKSISWLNAIGLMKIVLHLCKSEFQTVLSAILSEEEGMENDSLSGTPDMKDTQIPYPTQIFGLITTWLELSRLEGVPVSHESKLKILRLAVSSAFEICEINEVMSLCILKKMLSNFEPEIADSVCNERVSLPVYGMSPGYLTTQFIFSYGARSFSQQNIQSASFIINVLSGLAKSESWQNGVKDLFEAKLKDEDFENQLFGWIAVSGSDLGLNIGSSVCYSDSRMKEIHGTIVDIFHHCNKPIIAVVDKKQRKHRMVGQNQVNKIVHANSIQFLLHRSYSAVCDEFLLKYPALAESEKTELKEVLMINYFKMKSVLAVESNFGAQLEAGKLKEAMTPIMKIACKQTGFSSSTTSEVLERLLFLLLSTNKFRVGKPPAKKGYTKAEIESISKHRALDGSIPDSVIDAISKFFEKIKKAGDKSILCSNQINAFLHEKWAPMLPPEVVEQVICREMTALRNLPILAPISKTPRSYDSGIQQLALSWAGLDSNEKLSAVKEHPDALESHEHDLFKEETESEFVLPETKNLNLCAMQVLVWELIPQRCCSETMEYLDWCISRVTQALVTLQCRRMVLEWMKSGLCGGFMFSQDYAHTAALLQLMYSTPELKSDTEKLISKLNGSACTDRKKLAYVACQMLSDSLPMVIHKSLPEDFRSCNPVEKDVVDFSQRIADYVIVKQELGADDDDFWLVGECSAVCFTTDCSQETGLCGKPDTWPITLLLGPNRKLFIEYKLHDGETKQGGLAEPFRLKMTSYSLSGRFEVANGILKRLLEIELQQIESGEGCAITLPLNQLWVWCIYIGLNCTGDRRLKVLHLLQSILLIYDHVPVGSEGEKLNLGALHSFYHLALDMWDSEGLDLEQSSSKFAFGLQRTLIDLFFAVENTAMKRNEAVDFLQKVCHPEQNLRLVRALGIGFKNVGLIGAAINLPNKATEACQAIQCRSAAQQKKPEIASDFGRPLAEGFIGYGGGRFFMDLGRMEGWLQSSTPNQLPSENSSESSANSTLPDLNDTSNSEEDGVGLNQTSDFSEESCNFVSASDNDDSNSVD